MRNLSKKVKTYSYFVCFDFSWNQMGNMILESQKEIKTNEDLNLLTKQIQRDLNLSNPPFITHISKL